MVSILSLIPENARVILDAGCGSGELASGIQKTISPKKGEVFGIDISKEALIAGKNKYKEVNFIMGDVEAMPLKDAIFDTVIMNQVIEHTKDDGKSIEEISRTTKPRGILIITSPHKGLFAFMDPLNFKKSKHRHYSLEILKDLLSPYFKIKFVSMGGFFIRPFAILLQAIRLCQKFCVNST